MNNTRLKGGINMNLNDSKLVFVVSPSDDDEQERKVKEVIEQLIKDDKKNKRDDLIYISSLENELEELKEKQNNLDNADEEDFGRKVYMNSNEKI